MPEIGPPEIGTVPRKEAPGEEAYRIAGELSPLIAWLGNFVRGRTLVLNHDALASIVSSVLKWWRGQ